jgi:hypothetical protein
MRHTIVFSDISACDPFAWIQGVAMVWPCFARHWAQPNPWAFGGGDDFSKNAKKKKDKN